MLPITHAHKNRQNWRVLACLLDGIDVHVKYAVNTLNIISLTSRIAELRKMGFIIDWRWEITPNSRYKIYFIKDKEKAKTLYHDIITGNSPQKTATPAKAPKDKATTGKATDKTTKPKSKRQNNGKPIGK